MKRSHRAHQAIADAIRDAMRRNRLDATAGDLIAAILKSNVAVGEAVPDGAFNIPASQVIRCADRAAEARHRKTTLSDLLTCLVAECSEELREYPQVQAAVEAALIDATPTWALAEIERRLGAPTSRSTTFLPGLTRLSYVVWACFATEEGALPEPTAHGCPAACIATSAVYDSDDAMPVDGWTIDPCTTHSPLFDDVDERDQ
ncbi:MAG: hypothetical protein QOJ39_1397 [Candidatus Eremiobacteraeota bacterium]|nr:hypothetical protein [Candidatus Eremiobacteraeota bacterium]